MSAMMMDHEAETPNLSPSPIPGVEETKTTIDWTKQTEGTKNFKERLADAYMAKPLFSDMSFLLECDNTLIPAHSLIVAAASSVLERFIFGIECTTENTDRIIRVPDCPPTEFHVLLRYLYTGTFEVLPIKTAAVLLPLAYYFNLRDFEVACSRLIEDNLQPINVCATFNQIYMLDNPLSHKCIQMMEEHADAILDDGSLMAMHDNALEKILNNNKLQISCESNVFHSMLVWADAQCKQQNLQPTSANRRSIINDRLYYVRFAAMTPDLFAKCLSMMDDGFLTVAEIADTFLQIAKRDG